MASSDYIKEALKKDGVSDSYPKSLAFITRNKFELKKIPSVGDVVLLVTKKGFENTASHVGIVKEFAKETVTFELNLRGRIQRFTLPLKSFSSKGFALVGFYTIK